MADLSLSSSSDRDSPTPPRSDSPGQVRRLSSKSSESLASHPLLGDTSDEAIPAAETSVDTSLSGPITSPQQQPAPYAVSYKTRQRPTSTTQSSQSSLGVFSQPSQAAAATTTSASATSPLPTSPSNSSSLTTKLQSQNLQASAQAAGLSSDSAGWYILQKLTAAAEKETEKDKALVTALKALRTGKGCLLLPRDHVSFSEVNSSFLRDHILLKDGRNVTTLGGVRGVLADDTIIFTSCVPAIDMKKPPLTEAAFTELLNPGTPAVGDGTFPSCSLGKPVDVHLPRHSPVPLKQEKPAARPRSLVNIFGGQRSVSSGSSTTLAKQEDPSAPPAGSLQRVQHPSESQSSLPVQAWTIQSPLHSKSIAKAIQTSIANHLQSGADLGDTQLNDMVLAFVRRFHPSSKTPIQPTPPASDPSHNLDEVDLANADIVAATAAMQEFYHDARQRLEAANRERLALSDALSDDDEKEVKASLDLIDVDSVLEKVEAFLCETLYDKLFAPASSTDRQDDESLSMRIAGLHMLDLTLDHLGIQTDLVTGDPEADDVQRTVRDGLEEIISLCGKEFQKLQYSDCRTPLAKLNVLVSVHKIIADSLEVLPPITMKDDSERRNSTTSPPVAGQVIEMSADTKSLGGRSIPKFSRSSSEASDVEKTPRLAASRPASTASANPPAIKLHDTSFTEPYQLSTPSEYIAEAVEPFHGAELETTDTTTRSAPPKPRSQNTTSADAILPLLIYAVVQANPVRLVSHVMFVQRFRADSLMAGEGEYCLCNMEAVRTFLMSCDVASLGLGSGKLISASDLPTPPVRIRQRAGQHIDSMVGTAVGSAGRVLGTAADIGIGGYRILGGLLARNPQSIQASQQPQTLEDVQSVLAGSSAKPASSIRQAILRRGTNTSMSSAKTHDSKVSKETEMSDVKAIGTSPSQDTTKSIQPVSSTASISSRLASLPGLTRLSSPSTGQTVSGSSADLANGSENAASTGLMSGFMSSMPSMPRPFAGNMNGNSPAPPAEADSTTLLTAQVNKDSQSRRSTISIFSTPYTSGSGQEVSTPLLSPTPSNLSMQGPVSPPFKEHEAMVPTDRLRSASFMSHSQHYEVLKSGNRPRSDSAASNSSGSAMGLANPRIGVAGAFGAVTNLVSNVRHAYSPSVSSQTSISKSAQGSAAAPIQRFLECEADDLKMSEVALLLADYKRLAARLNETTRD